MNIVTHRTVYFWITGVILAGALGAIIFFGLPLDVDFTGGSLMQVRYQSPRPPVSLIEQQVATIPLGTVFVRETGADAISIRTRTMTPAEHDAVLGVLARDASITELSYTSVGPTLGGQFANKALWAILAVALAIMLYIAFAFRKVSRPVPSWGYGLAVIACLLHDLIIPAGLFAVLAHYTSVQVDALFVTALLALLGYSVNDTIVIFDRVREHLAYNENTHH
jgi:preprotein translocase subunit SecF